MIGGSGPAKEAGNLVHGDKEMPDLAREGLAHLQTAAHEMIAAARSMLDACEELLEDPRAGEALTSVIGSVARVVGGISGLAPSEEPDEDSREESRVQHIKIS